MTPVVRYAGNGFGLGGLLRSEKSVKSLSDVQPGARLDFRRRSWILILGDVPAGNIFTWPLANVNFVTSGAAFAGFSSFDDAVRSPTCGERAPKGR